MSVSSDPVQLADLALQTPGIDTDPPPRYRATEVSYGMTIGIERTPGGRLWAAWVGGGDNDKAYMALATSDDDGVTWTDARAIVDPHDPALPLARRSIVGNLWTDPRGRLWFFFDQAMTFFDGRAGNWASRCDNPDADAPTWSTPTRLWHGCSLNKPIVLSDGTWVLPVSLWERRMIHPPFKDSFHELDPRRGANILVSTDEGATWTWRGGVAFPQHDFDELSVVERRDGTLWMTARTLDLGVWESFSTDAGKNWSAPRESPIRNVNSRHQIRRLQSGRLLLIKHGPDVHTSTTEGKIYTGRRELTAFLSDDDGLTWRGGLSIDERDRVTYPDVCQSPDGSIYVSYDHERETLGHVLLAKFREEDVLAGAPVSADARFKQVIFRPLKPRS